MITFYDHLQLAGFARSNRGHIRRGKPAGGPNYRIRLLQILWGGTVIILLIILILLFGFGGYRLGPGMGYYGGGGISLILLIILILLLLKVV